jgi:hypothetical protein
LRLRVKPRATHRVQLVPTDWQLLPGDVTTRVELASQYGGSPVSGGIVPANESGNLFLFSDPRKGGRHGYNFDGLSADGLAFDYTGSGQTGDQVIKGLNLSLLEHRARAMRLQVFVADGKVPGTDTTRQKYVGEFALDGAWGRAYRRQQVRTEGGRPRSVLVFRLLPADMLNGLLSTPRPRDQSNGLPVIVSLEADDAYLMTRPPIEAASAARREAEITRMYQAWLNGRDGPATRWAIPLLDSSSTLLTDIYFADRTHLFEAKSAASRESVRLAIGQLLDYGHHLTVPGLRRSVLLPSAPPGDLLDLLNELGFGCVAQSEEHGFQKLLAARRRDQMN